MANKERRERLLAACFGVLVCIFTFASADSIPQINFNLEQGSGSVEFHAIGHPSAIKIVGKGDKPHGNIILTGRKVSGAANFDLTSLTTGISMRDKHMKEKYLETQKYSEAKLSLTMMELPQDMSEGVTMPGVPFAGTLSLHGVEKPVKGLAKIERKGNQVTLNAEFSLKIADFKIDVPTFAGITMADEVHVLVEDTLQIH